MNTGSKICSLPISEVPAIPADLGRRMMPLYLSAKEELGRGASCGKIIARVRNLSDVTALYFDVTYPSLYLVASVWLWGPSLAQNTPPEFSLMLSRLGSAGEDIKQMNFVLTANDVIERLRALRNDKALLRLTPAEALQPGR